MPAALVAIWEAICAGGVWIATVGRTALPWLFGPGGLAATIRAWIAINLVNTGVRMAISVAVLTGWAAFLAVVTTGMFNFGATNIFAFLFTNPISGLPHDMYALFCSVFPFGFFVRIVCAYVLWNFTFQAAAITVMRGVKFLFGG